MHPIAIVIIVGCLLFGGLVLGSAVSLLGYFVSGLIVGGLARLAMPGNQNMGLVATSLYGVAGGLAGGVIGNAMKAGTFVELALSVVAAVALITVFRSKA